MSNTEPRTRTLLIQPAITLADFQANAAYHFSRLNSPFGGVMIPVLATDDAQNPYAFTLMDVDSLLNSDPEKNQRLLEFYHSYHANQGDSVMNAHMITMPDWSSVQEKLVDGILEKRSSLNIGEMTHAYAYSPPCGFVAVFNIFSKDENLPFNSLSSPRMLVVSNGADGFHTGQLFGGDTRPRAEID